MPIALYRISELSHFTENMDDFFREAHSIIGELIYAENFFIALYDKSHGRISMPYIVDVVTPFNKEDFQNMPEERLNKTLTGYMLRTGNILHADTAMMHDLREKGEVGQVGKDSVEWVGVPLKLGEEVLGAVVVQSYNEKFTYTTSDIELLKFLSRHLATVLQRKQTENELRKSRAQLELRVFERTEALAHTNDVLSKEIKERKRTEQLMKALYQIAVMASEAQDMQQFYEHLHDIVDSLIKAPNLYIALQGDRGQSVEFPYYQNQYYASPTDQPHLIQQMEIEYIQNVISSRRSLRFSHDEERPKNKQRNPMFSSWLGVPLKDEEQNTIGVLSVLRYNLNEDFDDDDQNLISYVAQQISSSISRQQQSQDLKDAHRELQEANNQLESRVQERTKELSLANEHLQEVIQERMKIEEKLAHDAFHDSLTGLPNRALFLDRLDKAIQNRQRNQEHTFAVLFLDLDRFKIINDSLGHYIGDLLLVEIASKLSHCVRPGDTVTRLGGDEFAILLIDKHTSRAAKAVARRIAGELSAPFELEGNMVFTSTSIGINLCEDELEDAADVLRDADTAMYAAKAKGKAQTAIFDKSMYEQAVKQLQLESELRRALEKEQIEVFYQPIIALETDEIIAFEALARWHHPKLGWVSPGEFIPIAEETGLISDIGLFIMDQALSQTIIWQNTNREFKNLMISVNLSSYQLADIDLYQDSMQIIQSHNFPADKLRLEVTESLLIDNFESAKRILNNYSDAGIKILLDDFGTGYSSLSYLHHFPIHVLKVDRSFVMEMDKRDENMAIISTIKTLASSLNMEVVAEGIEENHQRRTLKNMGFEYGQGFYFARPMPANEITKLLKSTIANGDALKLIPDD